MQKLKNRLILILVIIVFNTNAQAKTSQTLPASSIISDISDKLALSLKDSNIHIELPYLYIPKNLNNAAVKKLQELSVNKEFSFHYINNQANRYGNYIAITTGNNGITLSEELLKNGIAFVYFVDNSIDVKPLFAAEGQARKSQIGLWHDNNSTIQNSNNITDSYSKYLNHFIIIEGQVDNIYTSKKNTYLNFGTDWKTDFTVQFENRLLKHFPEFIPDKLKGKRLRVRGWLESYNGPFMKIFNPANVEIIN